METTTNAQLANVRLIHWYDLVNTLFDIEEQIETHGSKLPGHLREATRGLQSEAIPLAYNILIQQHWEDEVKKSYLITLGKLTYLVEYWDRRLRPLGLLNDENGSDPLFETAHGLFKILREAKGFLLEIELQLRLIE